MAPAFSTIDNTTKSFINNYVINCLNMGVPMVALSEEHKNYVIHQLTYVYHRTVNTIKKDENIIISCKHYPFTCDEADQYLGPSNAHMTWEHTDGIGKNCSCLGDEVCAEHINDRHYHQFSWGDQFMKHYNNCCDDCCCKNEIYERYLIIID